MSAALNMFFDGDSFPAVVRTFIGSNSVSGINTTSHTFAAQSIGTASADRYVVVGIVVSEYTSTMLISSVSIGGVSASVLAQVRPSSNDIQVALYMANVPTGTTGDIVITTSGANIRQAAIGVWTLTNLQSATPASTGTDNTDTAGSAMTIAVTAPPVGSAVIAVAAQRSTTGFAWTNQTEDFDLSDSTNRFSGASDSYPAGAAGYTVTATGTSGNNDCSMVLAVMR